MAGSLIHSLTLREPTLVSPIQRLAYAANLSTLDTPLRRFAAPRPNSTLLRSSLPAEHHVRESPAATTLRVMIASRPH
ncbi:hypothetical protein CEP54_013326, partial [Fusarium duplospermum]